MPPSWTLFPNKALSLSLSLSLPPRPRFMSRSMSRSMSCSASRSNLLPADLHLPPSLSLSLSLNPHPPSPPPPLLAHKSFHVPQYMNTDLSPPPPLSTPSAQRSLGRAQSPTSFTALALNKPVPHHLLLFRLLHLESAVALGVLPVHCVSYE